jgi:ketosteroid isomerase-like protein
MSQENAEVVRRSYEAFMRGDQEAALSAYSRHSEWDDTRFRPEGKVHRGRDEIVEVVRNWVGTWADYSIKLERLIDAGNRVVVLYEERGTGKGSGLRMTTRVGMLITVAAGQITRTVVYPNPGEALEAVGLSEQDAHADS